MLGNPKNENPQEMIRYQIFGFIICHQSIKLLHKLYQCLLIIPMKSQNRPLKVLHVSCQKQVKNYRPITCLSTMYKLTVFTLFSTQITFFLQRGLHGCKDQLLINKMILENCKKRCRNLSTGWIDYLKAFNSMPHYWILKTLEMYKVSLVVVNFLKHSMGMWKSTLYLNHKRHYHIQLTEYSTRNLSRRLPVTAFVLSVLNSIYV